MARQTVTEVVSAFAEAGIPAAPVQTYAEAAKSDVVRERVLADPRVLGGSERMVLPASDDVDMLYKGVLDRDGCLMPWLSLDAVRTLIEDGVISGGMIPKIESVINVVSGGVDGVVIQDGRIPHIVLLELFTEHGVDFRH